MPLMGTVRDPLSAASWWSSPDVDSTCILTTDQAEA